jgi:hypothetical protein
VGLLNAENCTCFYLCEAAILDDAVDLQSEVGLELLPFGTGETDIRKTRCRCFFRRLYAFVSYSPWLIAPLPVKPLSFRESAADKFNVLLRGRNAALGFLLKGMNCCAGYF